MTNTDTTRRDALQSILACLQDETARRADGGQPGSILFDTKELDALVALLRREVEPRREAQGR